MVMSMKPPARAKLVAPPVSMLEAKPTRASCAALFLILARTNWTARFVSRVSNRKGLYPHGKICFARRLVRQAGIGVGARCQYGKRALLQHRRLRRNVSRLGCRLLRALPGVAGPGHLGLCLDGYTHRSSLLLPGIDLLQPYHCHAAQRW